MSNKMINELYAIKQVGDAHIHEILSRKRMVINLGLISTHIKLIELYGCWMSKL